MKTREKHLIVVGSRTFEDYRLLSQISEKTIDRFGPNARVSIRTGDSLGADHLTVVWARLSGIPYQVFDAQWERFDRAAGPIRSAYMLSGVEPKDSVLLCFVDKPLTSCKGSWFTVSLARRRGIIVEVYPEEFNNHFKGETLWKK